ncbi:MAG: hypothetical protein P1U57_04280, partial [Oleibacter sp.]|nr:hypothetical protein [Thalassolituus sp.]
MNHTIRNVFLLMANVLSHALWGTTAWADSLSINVIDEQGQPIANAVVLVDSDADVTIGQTKSSPATAKIMDQVNVQFSPRLLLVNHGDYVNFPNSDNVRHHVYSFSEAQPFELRLYAGKPENPIQFTNSG